MIFKAIKISQITDSDGFTTYSDVPSLIIGWSNAKKYFPNTSIKNEKIGENLYWTFSDKEKKIDYEENMIKFTDKCVSHIKNRVKYHFINPFHLTYSEAKFIIKTLAKKTKKVGFITENCVFISVNNIVFGINIEFFTIINIDREKIIGWLNKNNIILYNNKDYDIELLTAINNDRYILPYIKNSDQHNQKFTIGNIFK